MNRNELWAMLYHSNEIAKLFDGSEECKHNVCAQCGYYAICRMNGLLRFLIEQETAKYNVKGELKDDND